MVFICDSFELTRCLLWCLQIPAHPIGGVSVNSSEKRPGLDGVAAPPNLVLISSPASTKGKAVLIKQLQTWKRRFPLGHSRKALGLAHSRKPSLHAWQRHWSERHPHELGDSRVSCHWLTAYLDRQPSCFHKVLSHSTNSSRTSFSSVMFSLRNAFMAPGYSR